MQDYVTLWFDNLGPIVLPYFPLLLNGSSKSTSLWPSLGMIACQLWLPLTGFPLVVLELQCCSWSWA